jgi:GT2 family glycosyltransferase
MLLTPMTLIRAALHLPDAFPQRQLLQFGEAPFETNWVCGSSMLVRTSMLREIGGFDPRYFLYFEETDLCLRASRNNYEIWAVGECIARHVGGVSARESGAELTSQQSGCIAKYFYPSRFYYLSKNFGLLRAVGAEVIAACIERTRWVAKKVLGRRPTSEDLPDARLFLRLPSRVDE